MTFEVPLSYSPSSLSQFTSCPLAFRFSYIERRPQPPQPAATKGTIVHRALELLFALDAKKRTVDVAHKFLDDAFDEFKDIDEYVDLQLNEDEKKVFQTSAHSLIDNYFRLEDPTQIKPIGLEVKLEAQVGDTLIRGIIDRLEQDDNGDLIVTDYKTGSVPNQTSEQSRLAGVHLYALLCEKVFGKLPSKVQLLYLSKPTAIIATPNPSSVKGIAIKSAAIHKAVVTACEKGDFRPKVSALCSWCGYRDLCPAQGGQLPSNV